MKNIFKRLLNVKGMVVEDVSIDDSPLRDAPVLVARVRCRKAALRCSRVFCQVVIGQCGVSFPSEKAVGFSPVRNWPVIARVLLFHCIRA